MNHMEIAIRSAGKGQKADYTWKSNSVSESGDRIRFLESMCGQGHGCALVSREGTIDAYFSGFKSGLEDYRQRDIFVALAFLGISETTARALMLLFMEDHSRFREDLLDALERPSADEWTADYEKVAGIAEEALNRANLNPLATPFDAPRSDDYNDKAAENESDGAKGLREARNKQNIDRLCREIRNHRFSDGEGLKLLVAATHPQAGYNKAREEADRLLWAEGSQDDLVTFRKKKFPEKTTDIPGRRSATPSWQRSLLSFGRQLTEFLVLEPSSPTASNPSARISRRKLSIICAVVAAFALGALVGSNSSKKERQRAVEQARKEKDREWEAKNQKAVEQALEQARKEWESKNAAPTQVPDQAEPSPNPPENGE